MKTKAFLRRDVEKDKKLRMLATFPMPESVLHPTLNDRLSPFEETKIKLILPEVQKILRGEIPFPVLAKVLLTDTCKHNCLRCPYGSDRSNEDDFLDPKNFGKLLKHLHTLKVRFIDLSGGGEPTLHPEFCRFVRMCIKEKFRLSLLSNGVWLDQDRIDLLIEGFSFLRVNLDANSDEVYDQIHHPSTPREFEKVLSNVEKIVSEKERRKSNLIVGAKARLCQANVNFIEEIINLVKDLGMGYIQFYINHNASDLLLPEQIRVVNKLINELKNGYRSFLVYGEFENLGKERDGCWLSPLHLIIDPIGNVYSCPHFPHNPTIASFGNIFTQPVEELWSGTKHRQMIDHLSMNDCPIEDCRWKFYKDHHQIIEFRKIER